MVSIVIADHALGYLSGFKSIASLSGTHKSTTEHQGKIIQGNLQAFQRKLPAQAVVLHGFGQRNRDIKLLFKFMNHLDGRLALKDELLVEPVGECAGISLESVSNLSVTADGGC